MINALKAYIDAQIKAEIATHLAVEHTGGEDVGALAFEATRLAEAAWAEVQKEHCNGE